MGKILELLDKHVRLDELPDDHPQREHFHAVVGDGEKHEKFRALLRKAGMNEDDIAEAMRLLAAGTRRIAFRSRPRAAAWAGGPPTHAWLSMPCSLKRRGSPSSVAGRPSPPAAQPKGS
ncbi:MAG: hypothetical protein ABSA68_18125 [Xanthobacteraceae bacterium]|jgi:hypothetical protein